MKHVFWVTLREVKPQYITRRGVARRSSRTTGTSRRSTTTSARALARHPQPLADRLGGGRRPAGADVRRDPPQHVRAGRVRREHRPRRDGAPRPRLAGPDRHRGDGRRRSAACRPASTAVSLNLAVTDTRARAGSSPRTRATSRGRWSATSTSSPTRPSPQRRSCPSRADGKVCVYTSAATNLIVDVMGSFSGDRRLRSAAGPTRLVDTREPRGSRAGAHGPLPVAASGVRRRRGSRAQRHRGRAADGPGS